MTKSDLMRRLELLRLAVDRLPEGADVDCAMVFEQTEFSDSWGNISLTKDLEKAAEAFGGKDVETLACGDRIYHFFRAGNVKVAMYADK